MADEEFPVYDFYPMDAETDRLRKSLGMAVLAVASLFFLAGCMTPEDKAFYGRGWINPDELDQEQPPPASFTDPNAVEPHMMGPGEY